MDTQVRERRLRRIAEIANETLVQQGRQEDAVLTPRIVKAVDDARRAEYYERLENAGLERVPGPGRKYR